MDTARLAGTLALVIRDADTAGIGDAEYLAALGISGRPRPAGEIWRELRERCLPLSDHDPAWDAPLAAILDRGCLARRILAALGGDVSRDRLVVVYRRLADCLEAGEVFHG
jgi:hypothetical protein